MPAALAGLNDHSVLIGVLTRSSDMQSPGTPNTNATPNEAPVPAERFVLANRFFEGSHKKSMTHEGFLLSSGGSHTQLIRALSYTTILDSQGSHIGFQRTAKAHKLCAWQYTYRLYR